jgi:hypothetical protein
MMSPMRTPTMALLLMLTFAVGLLTSSVPAQAGDRGTCTSAFVSEPFRAPDGSLHEAGKLTICASREYSPVSWLHATYIDGYPVGMWMSRRGSSEGLEDGGRPFIMFRRDAAGLLHLSGYASPAGNTMVTYQLDLARVEASQRVAAREGPAGPTAGPAALILAARVD